MKRGHKYLTRPEHGRFLAAARTRPKRNRAVRTLARTRCTTAIGAEARELVGRVRV